MDKLESLLEKAAPPIGDARMITNGYGVWVAWRADLNPAVAQTLSDYGGMQVASERHQSLWFFFSGDVVLALARLEIWVRFNPIPVFIQVFPAKLILGMKLEVSLSVDSSLKSQEAQIPNEFEAWVHPRVREDCSGVPGIGFEKAQPAASLSKADWKLLAADPRLPYQSSLGWYLVLKPLGNPLEKTFQSGWREFFPHLEGVIKRLKLPYLINNFFLLFQLDNLRQLRTWSKEFLYFIGQLKEATPELYWPCVMAVVEKRGLNFNVELPNKIALDWDQLMPDFPHMSYRTAFLLGSGFKINDVRFLVEQSSMDDWCNVSLSSDSSSQLGALEIVLPKRLVTGKEAHCFYCGLRSHKFQDCPSRGFSELNPGIWEQIAVLSLEDINEGLNSIEKVLSNDPQHGVQDILNGSGTKSVLLKAIFEINTPVQHRMGEAVWRSSGKDYPKGLQQLAPKDSGPVWSALEELHNGEPIAADKILSQAIMKSPRNLSLYTMQGYTALERDDKIKAMSLWKEAELLCTTPLQQAYHIFLQARCLEIQGKLQQASELYKKILTISPKWLDAMYREGVCLVKMGFAEQAMGFFMELFQRDPNMFNRMLIDSELERGYIQILSSLYHPWLQAEERAMEEQQNLEELQKDAAKWFPEGNPFLELMLKRIGRLKDRGATRNYVAYSQVTQGRMALSRDFLKKVEEEGRQLKSKSRHLIERLRIIQNEASWFPFPKVLVEFNKDFNYCARNLNWAFSQHFQMADNFRRGTELIEKVEERLEKLESQLRTLKIVRDSTLFMLIMGKTFFWLELIGLFVCMAVLPLATYYGGEMGYGWAKALDEIRKWEIQKNLVIIVSITSLAMAGIRAALIFEGRKAKLFKRAQGIKE